MAKTKKPIPVEKLPRLPDSEEHRVAVSEERLAEEDLQDRPRLERAQKLTEGRAQPPGGERRPPEALGGRRHRRGGSRRYQGADPEGILGTNTLALLWWECGRNSRTVTATNVAAARLQLQHAKAKA